MDWVRLRPWRGWQANVERKPIRRSGSISWSVQRSCVHCATARGSDRVRHTRPRSRGEPSQASHGSNAPTAIHSRRRLPSCTKAVNECSSGRSDPVWPYPWWGRCQILNRTQDSRRCRPSRRPRGAIGHTPSRGGAARSCTKPPQCPCRRSPARPEVPCCGPRGLAAQLNQEHRRRQVDSAA